MNWTQCGVKQSCCWLFLTAYVREMTVTGTVLSWKAIPSRAGSGTQEYRSRRVSAPSSFCLHGRQTGSGKTPPPDPWTPLQPRNNVTPSRGEGPCEAVPGVSLQDLQVPGGFLIAYFQSWQSQPDPNMANGLPDMAPTKTGPPPSATYGSLDSKTRGGL